MTLIRDFVSKFDASNKIHVQWLALLTKESASPGPGLVKAWSENPLGINVDGFAQMQETAEIHFVMMAKYASAVFSSEAYIPPPPIQEI